MKVDLNGNFEVPAAAKETFAFITTPARFAPVLPYFKDLKDVAERSFVVVLEVGVPQIRGLVEVKTELVDVHPPERAIYNVRGRHALGMMDSIMTFEVAATSSGSNVKWRTESIISGTLVSLANGILIPLAKRQINALVASVRDSLSGVGELPQAKPERIMSRGASSLRGLFGSAKGGVG